MTGWWFPAMPRARVAWLRTFLYAFIWLDVLLLRPWVREHGDLPGVLYDPLRIGELFHLPTPTATVVTVVMVALLACSAVAATGRAPRVLGLAIAFLYLEWMVIAFSYGKVDHDRFGFLVALFVLPTVGAVSRRDRTPDERAGWAIRCVQVAVVCTYFLSVVAKHRYGRGLDTWLDSTTLLRAVVRRGTFLADPLLENPWTLHVTQYLIVGMELASPLLLVPGRVGRWLLAVLVGFHAVTFACLTIAFWPHLATLLAFLPLERVADSRSGARRSKMRGMVVPMRRFGGVLLALSALLVLGAPAPADAFAGAPWFRPGRPYTENFPDPSVVRVGSTYYAYGTSTGGAYLPVMTSTDLVTWTARRAYDPGPPLNSDPYFNDALPYPAAWSPDRPVGGRLKKEVWAPGAAKIGNRYVAFYAARVALDRDRFCIAVATSSSPLGPFTDSSRGPIVCDTDPNGSIDPQPFVDDDGTPYLLWKSEGVPGRTPTRIWIRRLDASGTAFAPGSVPASLLGTSQRWEGNVIENPSMVRSKGRLYLFYSGNEHLSGAYATGYATCSSPVGPCTKWAGNPVLRSRGNRLGPGGPAAFVDAGGQLRLAYHWWNAPYTNYPAFPACQSTSCTNQGQRRLAVEPVHVTPFGLQVGGTPPPFGGDLAVGLAPTRTGDGYWIAGRSGGLAAKGDAVAAGGPSNPGAGIMGIAATPSGAGYWMSSADGGVFAYGDAPFLGSVAHVRLTRPVVGMAATPTGRGYWLVASDGGIFSFGDARFVGSTGAIRLNQPIVGMAATPTGRGYWLVASDGGIFSFGDARFVGSTGAIRLNQPIVGMTPTARGDGYWLVASDGGLFTFGRASYLGSTGGRTLPAAVTGMARTPTSAGYWLVAANGSVYPFGDARDLGSA
jgi:hypothetical protein